MKQVTIHGGVHKTGTSSIQEALHAPINASRLEIEGFWVPRSLPPNQSQFFVSAFGSRPEKYHANAKHNLSRDEIERRIARQTDRLLEDLGAAAATHIVFSGEDISTLGEGELRKLGASLTNWFGSGAHPRFIFYTRHPESFVESAIQQNVKGNGMTIERSKSWHIQRCSEKYESIVCRFESVFGADSVELFSFEQARQRYGSVVAHFGKILSPRLELQEPGWRNRGICDQIVRFISECNAAGHELCSSDREILFRLPGSRGSVLSEADRVEIAEISHRDRKFLSERFGISYPDRPADSTEKMISDSDFCQAAKQVLPSLEHESRRMFVDFLIRMGG